MMDNPNKENLGLSPNLDNDPDIKSKSSPIDDLLEFSRYLKEQREADIPSKEENTYSDVILSQEDTETDDDNQETFATTSNNPNGVFYINNQTLTLNDVDEYFGEKKRLPDGFKRVLLYICIFVFLAILAITAYYIGIQKNNSSDNYANVKTESSVPFFEKDFSDMGGVPVPEFSESEDESSSSDENSQDSSLEDSSNSSGSHNSSNGNIPSIIPPSDGGTDINPSFPTIPPDLSEESPSSSGGSSSGGSSSSGGGSSDSGSSNTSQPEFLDMVSVTVNGSVKKMNATEAVAGWVATEINHIYPKEAIKAQAVAAYTYIKYYNSKNSAPVIYMSNPHENILNATKEVAGVAIYVGNNYAFTPWHAMSIGVTLDSTEVWGGNVSNLKSVDSSIEIGFSGDSYSQYKSVVTYSTDSIKAILESKLGITLSNNPENWFKIKSHYKTVNFEGKQIGYVKDISIDGQVTKNGRFIREQLLNGLDNKRFRSSAFSEPVYNSSANTLTFSTYGYGHGCGMSQIGMRLYAQKEGWSYDKILRHYYTGVTVK